MDGPQDFGVATGHARRDASLERLEMCQDGWGLQHRQEEAEDLQSGADVGDVRLRWLLLQEDKKGGKKQTSERLIRQSARPCVQETPLHRTRRRKHPLLVFHIPIIKERKTLLPTMKTMFCTHML